LLSKGLDVHEMLGDDVHYSAKDMRIIFKTPQGHIGRTVANAEPKWCTYGVAACTHASFNLCARAVIVLTEDYLSARKVAWATSGNSVIAQLGTRISHAMLSEVLASDPRCVVGFYDGDVAGDDADKAARIRFGGLGIKYCSVKRDPDMDPKDHTALEIVNKIQEALQWH
jgi:hypothetical protein